MKKFKHVYANKFQRLDDSVSSALDIHQKMLDRIDALERIADKTDRSIQQVHTRVRSLTHTDTYIYTHSLSYARARFLSPSFSLTRTRVRTCCFCVLEASLLKESSDVEGVMTWLLR